VGGGIEELLIEINDEYKNTESQSESDDDDDATSDEENLISDYDYQYDDQYDDNEEEEENSSTIGNLVRSFSESSTFKSIKGVVSNLLPKHQNRILLLLILYGFRRQILSLVFTSVENPQNLVRFLLILQLIAKFVFSGDNFQIGKVYTPPTSQHFMFENLNTRYQLDASALLKGTTYMNKGYFDVGVPSLISNLANLLGKKESRHGDKMKDEVQQVNNHIQSFSNHTVVVMEIKPDQMFSNLRVLQDAISFIIRAHRNPVIKSMLGGSLEVLLKLESPGGSVQDYGLAAKQLERFHAENIKLSIVVDRVAASGGYMLACQATPGHLWASPFAILGSIGVIGQSVNINDVLEKYGIKPLVFKSSEAKMPIGLIGDVTDEGKSILQDQIDSIHRVFKEYVLARRPGVDIETVASGAVWLGSEALKHGLIDGILTSEEYITQRTKAGDCVLEIKAFVRQPFFQSLYSPPLVTNLQGKLKSIFHKLILG